MTEEQGDIIIELLQDIYERLGNLPSYSNSLDDIYGKLREMNNNLDDISSNTL